MWCTYETREFRRSILLDNKGIISCRKSESKTQLEKTLVKPLNVRIKVEVEWYQVNWIGDKLENVRLYIGQDKARQNTIRATFLLYPYKNFPVF